VDNSVAVNGSKARRGADDAVLLARTNPRRAMTLAAAASSGGAVNGDWAVVSTAERALGLASRELRDIVAALAHLRRAVAVADEHELEHEAAEARMSLSLTLAFAGDHRGALREVDSAAALATGPEAARLEMQRSLILQRLGRHDDALRLEKRRVDFDLAVVGDLRAQVVLQRIFAAQIDSDEPTCTGTSVDQSRRELPNCRIQVESLSETRSISVNLEFPSLAGLFAPQRHSGAAKICCIPGRNMF